MGGAAAWEGRLQRLQGHLAAAGPPDSRRGRPSPSLARASTSASASQAPLQVVLSPEVRMALQEGKAVVALESTIISHGMPYPQNYETAVAVEGVVRANGAVPATIAFLAGVPHVGLTDDQIRRVAQLGHKAVKCSRRDIPTVVARGITGATTVSATMILAALAGIEVFVTGGIGGVHRGGHDTMDISADLTELGRTPVAVVCAGVKSVLDIPRTLEYLETQGVCVAAYQADEFPAFFTPRSGCKAPHRVDTPVEVAKMILAASDLGLGSGLVVGVPIPPHHAAEAEPVEGAIKQALEEMGRAGVAGNDVTPFLLQRISELTGGASLASNIALIKHNAKVGAQFATALAELRGTAAPGW